MFHHYLTLDPVDEQDDSAAERLLLLLLARRACEHRAPQSARVNTDIRPSRYSERHMPSSSLNNTRPSCSQPSRRARVYEWAPLRGDRWSLVAWDHVRPLFAMYEL